MKQQFSNKWVASKQPRKQRKYRAKAPLHRKRKMLAATLSAGLKIRLKKRSKVLQKGDKVKIRKGKFKDKEGKVLKVWTKTSKITVEGLTVTKKDGSNVNVRFWPWDVKITETVSEEKGTKTQEKKEKMEKKETTKKTELESKK